MDRARSGPESGQVEVRELADPAEMRTAVELYRDVFELAATDPAVSPRLLAAFKRHGGSVLGAFSRQGGLVGFAYGFVGLDADTGELYHYSQLAVVARGWQGRGVGRALKVGQRNHVLKSGITHMRWVFDPVRTANAHFNLDVLGARARWFLGDMYGVEDTGRDPGVPSDRMMVDWNLAESVAGLLPPALPPPPAGMAWGERLEEGPDVVFALPAEWEAVVRDTPDEARRLRSVAAETFSALLADGYEAISCRRAGGEDDRTQNAVYRLRRETS